MTAALIAVAVGVVALVGWACWRVVRPRAGQWLRVPLGPGSWRLVNRTGARALEVRVEVRGRLRAVGLGDVGDVGRDMHIEFFTEPSEAGGSEPYLRVTWQDGSRGRRRLWAAPLGDDVVPR